MLDHSRKIRLPVHLRIWLPLIFGLAFGIRVAFAIVHPFWHPNSADHPFTFPDSADYHALALALLHHQPYEVGGLFANRMPGYPLFLATIYAVTGASVGTALVVQAIFGTLIVPLTYLLARRVSQSVALVAATLVAFDPLTIGFTAALLSETPFTLVLLLILLLCLRILRTPLGISPSSGFNLPESQLTLTTPPYKFIALARWFLLGILVAIAVYLRASVLWLILPLSLCILLLKKPLTRAALAVNLSGAVLALFVLFVILSPWLIRNYKLFHSGFFRLTTLEGISLYEAVYPEADGGPRQDKIPLPPEMQPLNEAERNDEWSHRAWQSISSDPVRITRLAIVKFARTWSPTFNAQEMRAPVVQGIMATWYIPLFILGLVGIFTRIPRQIRFILLVPILYFSLLHSLFLGSIRYRVPLMPLVCIFAAIGLSKLVKRPSSAKPSQTLSV